MALYPYYQVVKRLFYFKFSLLGILLYCIPTLHAQDLGFQLNVHLLDGKKILKIKRDFNDPYVWVLAEHNEVYRINSLSMDIQSFTSNFTQYQDLKFIDIAGYSKDEVFIASNTTNVIIYKRGIISTIGLPQGLNDNVKSIGVSNFTSGLANIDHLLVGTEKGMADYDIPNDVFTYNNVWDKARDIYVFESTYRKLMYKDEFFDQENPADFPAAYHSYSQAYSVALYKYPESGSRINTAFYTLPTVLSPGGDYQLNLFWGNDNGMYQQAHIDGFFKHYLDNIKVNKITDIYGFLNLGNPNTNNDNLIKENLLIGTDKGLYYSSSLYGKFTIEEANLFSLYRYDELGDLKINDICVNSTASSVLDLPSGCENGVWLASDNGVYLLNPDYSGFLDPNQIITALNFGTPEFADQSTANICEGSSIDIKVNNNFIGKNTFQWYRNGIELPGQTSDKLTVSNEGTYSAVLFNACENVHLATNQLTVQQIKGPFFLFDYPVTLDLCDEKSTELKVDAGAEYHYRWYRNNLLTGDVGKKLTVNIAGKYKIEVSSCPDSWVTSKEITVNLNTPTPVIRADKQLYCAQDVALLSSGIAKDQFWVINWYRDGVLIPASRGSTEIKTTIGGNYNAEISSADGKCLKRSPGFRLDFAGDAEFKFDYDDKIQKCAGETLLLTVQGKPGYSYRWYKDGVLNGVTATDLPVTETGNYRVEVSNCSGNWVSSKEVRTEFLVLPKPLVSSDKMKYCEGDVANLSSNLIQGTDYVINWYKDGKILPQYKNSTFLPNVENGGYMATVTNDSGCQAQSSVVSVEFSPVPVVKIQQKITPTLCEGQTQTLRVTHDGGTVNWSTGESGDEIRVRASGTYSATLTSGSGCTATDAVTINFDANPAFFVEDVFLCEYSHDEALITAPAGYKMYTWNGVPGGNVYQINKIGEVSLVVQDYNGCTTTQKVSVKSKCMDISIPDAFSPNGDGVNDYWVISGLDGNTSAEVNVYNRYGALVYREKGIVSPWDGTYRHKKLAAGVYYYLIKVNKGKQLFSGHLTLLY